MDDDVRLRAADRVDDRRPVESVEDRGLGTERGLTLACEALERFGFEPARAAPTRVFLRNCPFHPLSARAPDVVCKVNQAYLSGLLDGLGATSAKAVPDPDPGTCCVRLTGTLR